MENELEPIEMPEDFSLDERQALEDFVNNGSPGIAKISESDIFQWFKLYMAGQTYSEIAIATKKKKQYILFMAKRQDWLQKKMYHFDDLLANMEEKLKQTKLESANTVSTIVSALGKHFGDQFLQFLTTNDASVIDNVDTKMLSQYYKSIEALDKLMGKASEGEGSPLVNFNLNSDAEVKQIDSKTVEITNKDGAGELLKLMAAAKKAATKEE